MNLLRKNSELNNVPGISGKRPFALHGRALRIGLLCGIAGILLDVDHLIKSILWPELPVVPYSRFLHAPLLIACSVALVGIGAYIGGLYIKVVLKGDKQCGK